LSLTSTVCPEELKSIIWGASLLIERKRMAVPGQDFAADERAGVNEAISDSLR
jgi:hypothetical protein